MIDPVVITTGLYSDITQVRLYRETLTHVVEQHQEIPLIFPHLPMVAQAIVSAIQTPTFIKASRKSTVVFVDHTTTNQVGDPLRVPVKVVEGTSGRVSTFFFATPDFAPTYLYRRQDG